jgi:hypothetical protein
MDGVLEYGSDNITVPEPGRYLVTLSLGVPDYSYTMVKYSSDGRNMFYRWANA